MSYISIIVPAFYIQNETDTDSILQYCSEQFETSSDSFDLIKLSLPNNYGIIFKESDISLSSIEDLIYQRDCIKSICEKTFESLQTMTFKLNQLETEITLLTENGNKEEDPKVDNINKKLPLSQLEHSDYLKINTERTLNTIKEEFKSIVQEFETLRTKASLSRPTSKRESCHSSRNVKRYGNKMGNNNFMLGSSSVVNNVNDGKRIIPKLNLEKKIE